MKKQILFILLTAFAQFAYAQKTVGEYHNSYFDKNYTIQAVEENEKITNLYIEIESKDAKEADISIKGEHIELFKTALELTRDKYLDWVRIAKENNVTKMHKEMGIKFPLATIAWLGTKWWFSFNKSMDFTFIILDSGKMVASYSPKVYASTNEYIDQQVYFVFASEEDFNSLINQLDTTKILDKLLSSRRAENLFQ